MSEPTPRVLESDGASALCWTWPQAAGPSLHWLRPRSADAPLTPAAVVGLAAACAGHVVATEDRDVSVALAAAGMAMVRHVHGLAADPAVVAAATVRDDVRLAPLEAATLEQLADLRSAAFPPGHPDHAEATLEERRSAYAQELADPANPVHAASRTAWLGERLVGSCLVTDSRHFPGFVGPWVMNVSRAPGSEARGVGALLLVAAARTVGGRP